MRTRSAIFGSVFFLLCSVVTLLAWRKKVNSESSSDSFSKSGTIGQTQAVNGSAIEANAKSESKVPKSVLRMGELESARLKVELPRPLNVPWEGPFFNSENCLEGAWRDTAVRLLPGWIRKMLREGRTDQAAKYLWTLLAFIDSKDREIAVSAVFSLYRLGDYDSRAIREMQKYLERGDHFVYFDQAIMPSRAGADDIRKMILRELEINNDGRLVDVVHKLWSDSVSSGKDSSSDVDYGYYLETNGRTLPVDYWQSRLKNNRYFNHTLEVLETRNASGLIEILQPRFTQLSGLRDIAFNNKWQAAPIAGLLYRLTRDKSYLDYLVSQARQTITTGTRVDTTSGTFQALAAIAEFDALNVLAEALKLPDGMIKEDAIEALGISKLPQAAELLFASASTRSASAFPSVEMDALLTQNTARSDAMYEHLKNQLLGGRFGRKPVGSDFDNLEYYKRYLRKERR